MTESKGKKVLKIPFDEHGYFVSYPGINFHERYEWKPNYVFEDELQFLGFYRGRSSAGITFESKKHKSQYTMFLIDFKDLILNNLVEFGKIQGKWTFVKRGTNFGVRFLNTQTI
jgi:hypothetical protein